MKTITQLIIQFTTATPAAAGDHIHAITHVIDINKDRGDDLSNILIKVEQTIHPEA